VRQHDFTGDGELIQQGDEGHTADNQEADGRIVDEGQE
jgi:hypothetical protein